ncbi:MAG TPA: alpha/beta hydrolase-fold protein [Puia sp.]|jgi:predicted alpha/beta superfamily hydrolase|nr:alpha/beta hydrolase-fold protein [Puia sp.]
MKTATAILTATFFTTMTLAQANKSKQISCSKPFVLGVIDEIQSKELGEKRILNIYLPEGYKPNDTTKYAVAYLLDGSADEDFIHVVGLYQFNSFKWINRVPKTIIIGIATIDRKRDFTYPTTVESDRKRYPTTGHSDKFIGFMEKELQPYIEKKFKTNSSKTIIGQSLGALLATEILLKKPMLFSKYILISPSLWWDNGSLLKQSTTLLQDSFLQKTDIYIGVGKEGLTPTEIPRVMEADANLLAEKIKNIKSKNVHVYFDYLPQEDHATVSHQAIFNALRLLFPQTTTKTE